MDLPANSAGRFFDCSHRICGLSRIVHRPCAVDACGVSRRWSWHSRRSVIRRTLRRLSRAQTSPSGGVVSICAEDDLECGTKSCSTFEEILTSGNF
uniref:Uncharacterized protein n=1 Tax=Romanomermis culicivorax TaxID=13658 RepID=A0A915JIV8_ROMCU